MPKTPSLAKLSIQELHQEIRARQRRRPALERRRAKLAAKVAMIDAEIAALGGTVSGSKRGAGPRNKGGLIGHLRKALTGKTLSVSEAAEAVKKAGYITRSPNFRVIVNGVLMRKHNGFKRVVRGQYTAA